MSCQNLCSARQNESTARGSRLNTYTVRGKTKVCAGVPSLLRGRAGAQLKGNIHCEVFLSRTQQNKEVDFEPQPRRSRSLYGAL